MAQVIELEKIPNQSLNIILDGNRYDITIKKTVEVMVIDIVRNGSMVVQGMRCLPKTLAIPYRYKEEGCGNFLFTTKNDDFPTYEQFGVTQFFFFFSDAELAVIRG